MLGNITKKIFGTPNDRYLKNSKTILENINSLEGELEKLNDDELKKNTLKLKEKFISGESLESLLPLSFATVREASKRKADLLIKYLKWSYPQYNLLLMFLQLLILLF